MSSIKRRDLDFLLFEVFDVEGLCRRPHFAEHSRDGIAVMLDTAEKIAAEEFAPFAAKTDAIEPSFDGKRVSIIPETKAALDAYRDAGFFAAGAAAADGGLQLPYIVDQAAATFFLAANAPVLGYPWLTKAAAKVIAKVGSDEQKATYLSPMLEGRWYGTMALTEPQAGSGLADLKTLAVPADDGSYRLSGNKVFISGGEHELSENIVHLVLARIKGAPAGTKGISLFIVSKFLVAADGSLADRNDVTLAGLIHKMGYRGTTSTMLNFGEKDGAVGYLLGAPHQGLAGMFHMMNEMRIAVGLGAVALGYAGYRHALEYAKTRTQGRSPTNRDPASPALPIIRHADVKRMLLAQKAYVEGGLALCLYGARLYDDVASAPDEAAGIDGAALLDLLTPIIKSWPSQWCLAANDLAIQVHGGYGYTREYPVERLYRDNRLNPIHEGTHGIHSLDLLRRKVLGNGGKSLDLLLTKIAATADDAEGTALLPEAALLRKAVSLVRETTAVLDRAGRETIDLALANSAVYLELLGHVVVAWLWLVQGLAAAKEAPLTAGDERNFYDGKLATCRWFFRWELPRIEPQARLLQSLDATTLEMAEAWF